jgi:pyruvate ferredoxin oxidoreductase gamma subunit
MIEMIICGRGGQGGASAKNFILESVMKKWLNSQGFPEYGAERRGAPVAVFIYIAEKSEFVPNSQIKESDCLVFFDATLLDNPKFVGFISNLKEQGLLIINTSMAPDCFNNVFNGRKATVDAAKIALELGIGDQTAPIVNTAMAGTIVRLLGFDFDLLCKGIRKNLGKAAEINIKAAQRGYDEVRYNE